MKIYEQAELESKEKTNSRT